MHLSSVLSSFGLSQVTLFTGCSVFLLQVNVCVDLTLANTALTRTLCKFFVLKAFPHTMQTAATTFLHNEIMNLK
jgi:hypothetical protein